MFIRKVRLGRLLCLHHAIAIHQAVLDAIRAGDAPEAERLVRPHCEMSVQPVVDYLVRTDAERVLSNP